MAGFNADLEPGRIARESRAIQSKKLMRGIKGIYSRCGGAQITELRQRRLESQDRHRIRFAELR
jgi:hypothetical protein